MYYSNPGVKLPEESKKNIEKIPFPSRDKVWFFFKIAFFGLASGGEVKRISPYKILYFMTNLVSDFE